MSETSKALRKGKCTNSTGPPWYLSDILIYLALLSVAGALRLVIALRMPQKKEPAARSSRQLSTLPLASAFIVTFAVWALMTYYFVSSDMSYDYVHSHSSTDLAWTYKVSAVWSGGEGSFLLWVLSMQGGLLTARLLFMRTEAGRTKSGLRLQTSRASSGSSWS